MLMEKYIDLLLKSKKKEDTMFVYAIYSMATYMFLCFIAIGYHVVSEQAKFNVNSSIFVAYTLMIIGIFIERKIISIYKKELFTDNNHNYYHILIFKISMHLLPIGLVFLIYWFDIDNTLDGTMLLALCFCAMFLFWLNEKQKNSELFIYVFCYFHYVLHTLIAVSLLLTLSLLTYLDDNERNYFIFNEWFQLAIMTAVAVFFCFMSKKILREYCDFLNIFYKRKQENE